MTGRLSKLVIELDVVHDGGEAAAEELRQIAAARAERAITDEGAEVFGGGGNVQGIGPDGPGAGPSKVD